MLLIIAYHGVSEPWQRKYKALATSVVGKLYHPASLTERYNKIKVKKAALILR